MSSRQRISDFQHHVNSHAREIRKAGDDAWSKINLASSEPQIVYDFLRSGTGHLNRDIGKLLSDGGRVVKFASIFLHQKPKVQGLIGRTDKPKTIGGECELGDLQILFLYIAADKSLRQCRSTIFQAKKFPGAGQYVINHDDQRRLYDNCSGFEYRSVLRGEQRWFPFCLSERERALQYLFVGQLPIQARLIPANANKGAFVGFGESIFRFLNDSTGFVVTAKPSHGKNWSRIVWDQIENVAYAAFANQGDRNAALKSILDRFNSFDDPKKYFYEVPALAAEAPGGIPMLLIIVSDGELGPEKIPQMKRANIKIVAEKGSTGTYSPTPTSVSVKHPTATGQTAEKGIQSNEQDLQTANIHDLLLKLETSKPNDEHDIVLEITRRCSSPMLMQYDAAEILKGLNRVCHILNPEISSLVYRLQMILRSREAAKIKVQISN